MCWLSSNLEPQIPGTRWFCIRPYRDCFTFAVPPLQSACATQRWPSSRPRNTSRSRPLFSLYIKPFVVSTQSTAVSFGSTYFYEEIFCQLKITKSRYWSFLKDEHLNTASSFIQLWTPSSNYRKIFSYLSKCERKELLIMWDKGDLSDTVQYMLLYSLIYVKATCFDRLKGSSSGRRRSVHKSTRRTPT
jgi:hypothetical protein